ncbi:MAG TPA: hypothetical protein ENK52_06050 [Saprospiraceae bacterium]|nr:hypothetical protein [Saprospiraceae bacterium]
MKILLLAFLILPITVFAAEKPSMTAMWLDLIFLLIVIISLKVADISNQQKLIIFIVYIVSGIATKSIWFPVILWLGLWYYFKKHTD